MWFFILITALWNRCFILCYISTSNLFPEILIHRISKYYLIWSYCHRRLIKSYGVCHEAVFLEKALFFYWIWNVSHRLMFLNTSHHLLTFYQEAEEHLQSKINSLTDGDHKSQAFYSCSWLQPFCLCLVLPWYEQFLPHTPAFEMKYFTMSAPTMMNWNFLKLWVEILVFFKLFFSVLW